MFLGLYEGSKGGGEGGRGTEEGRAGGEREREGESEGEGTWLECGPAFAAT